MANPDARRTPRTTPVAVDIRRLSLVTIPIVVLLTSFGVGYLCGVHPLLGILAPGGLFAVFGIAKASRVTTTTLAVSGLSDIPSRIASVAGVSPLGAFTILIACGSWLNWILNPRIPRPLAPIMAAFLSYVVWGLISSIVWTTPTVEGLQGLAVTLAFVGLLLVSANSSRRSVTSIKRLDKWLVASTLIASGLYLLGRFLADESSPIQMGPRSYALLALIGLSWLAAQWRYGSRKSFVLACIALGVIGISLSRTALAVGLLVMALAQLRPHQARGWASFGAILIVVLSAFYALITYVQALNERFFRGDVSLSIGGVGINMMGRTRFWNLTWESVRQSPWIGHGAGSARQLLESQFGHRAQPHQDYLRILHDFGAIGFTFWIIGYALMVATVFRAWLRADRRKNPDATVHLAALLAVISLALTMLTDNSVIYMFVMGPLAVLVGTSVGLSTVVEAPILTESAKGLPIPKRVEDLRASPGLHALITPGTQ